MTRGSFINTREFLSNEIEKEVREYVSKNQYMKRECETLIKKQAIIGQTLVFLTLVCLGDIDTIWGLLITI